jgi:hypothetical protein
VTRNKPTDVDPSHQRSRKRLPKPDSRRALELLAGCRGGCTESMMLAHGFTITTVELTRGGCATANTECAAVR